MLIAPAVRLQLVSRVASGESIRRVAAELGLSLSTAYYHAGHVCSHQKVLDLNALEEKELGYLVGLYVGDGSLIRHKERGEFLIKIALDTSRDSDIIDLVGSIFQKAGKRVTLSTWRSVTFLRIWSKRLYDFMCKRVLSVSTTSSNRHTKILLNSERWSREFAVGFLGGLIDSDGHIVRNRALTHSGAYITTSSISLRNQLQSLCRELGLRTTLHVDNRGAPTFRPRYIVYITSNSMRKVCSEILSAKHQRFHGGPGRT